MLSSEAFRRHELGYPEKVGSSTLPVGELETQGTVHWRQGGEKHAWTPLNIANIQQAARAGDPDAYKRFSAAINEQTARECHLRGLLKFRTRTSIPLQQVESAKEIVKRFCTGAMSSWEKRRRHDSANVQHWSRNLYTVLRCLLPIAMESSGWRRPCARSRAALGRVERQP